MTFSLDSFFQQHLQKKKEDRPFLMIAGPCAIEGSDQLQQIVRLLKQEHIGFLRGGVFKMRTDPGSFQGLGGPALKMVQDLKKEYDFKFVSEVTDPRQIEGLSKVVDVFQVGARNMYNYELLKELGAQAKPVLLKRAFSALVKEWLLAMEYVRQKGNNKIILCERGIRTFETTTRNTLDLSGALLAQKESGLPVIVDPSHGTGVAELVPPIALASVAAGLDGLLVEVHPDPKSALSDGPQSLDFSQFKNLLKGVQKVLSVMGRELIQQSYHEPR